MTLHLVSEPLELLALSGSVAPLMLTNVSYMTRDALLLYCALRFAIDIASLRRLPTGTPRTLLSLVRSWGIDGQLLHDVEAEPLVISDISGQWSLARRGGQVAVAAQVTSRSDLDESTELCFRLAALIGPQDLVSSALGVTAALWRAKRHEAFPWATRVTELEQLYPSEAVRGHLKTARIKADSDRLEKEASETAEDVRKGLALRARLLCVMLLTVVPIVSFRASAPAAATVALLATPSFSLDLSAIGEVLRVLYSLGLDGRLAAELAHLSKRPHGDGGESFKRDYLAVHATVSGRVGRSSNTEGAMVALRRRAHRVPGVKADPKVFSGSPLTRLETSLDSLARALPSHHNIGEEEKSRGTPRDAWVGEHETVLPALSSREAAAVSGHPPAALSAARAGAALQKLLLAA